MKHIITVVRVLFLALFLFLIVTGHMLLWFALFAVSLLLAPIFGRLYCGYACPMNTLMIPTARISSKLYLQSQNTPRWLAHGYIPWVALVASAAVMLLSRRFLHADLPILLVWLVLAVLVTFRYRPAVFHSFICPFGVLQKTVGRFALLSKRVMIDACVGCRACERVCPSGAVSVRAETGKAVINPGRCHQCAECRTACKKDAITYCKKL